MDDSIQLGLAISFERAYPGEGWHPNKALADALAREAAVAVAAALNPE